MNRPALLRPSSRVEGGHKKDSSVGNLGDGDYKVDKVRNLEGEDELFRSCRRNASSWMLVLRTTSWC